MDELLRPGTPHYGGDHVAFLKRAIDRHMHENGGRMRWPRSFSAVCVRCYSRIYRHTAEQRREIEEHLRACGIEQRADGKWLFP